MLYIFEKTCTKLYGLGSQDKAKPEIGQVDPALTKASDRIQVDIDALGLAGPAVIQEDALLFSKVKILPQIQLRSLCNGRIHLGHGIIYNLHILLSAELQIIALRCLRYGMVHIVLRTARILLVEPEAACMDEILHPKPLIAAHFMDRQDRRLVIFSRQPARRMSGRKDGCMHHVAPLDVLLDVARLYKRMSEHAFPGKIIYFHPFHGLMPEVLVTDISCQYADLVPFFQKALDHIIKNAFPSAHVRVEMRKHETDFHVHFPRLSVKIVIGILPYFIRENKREETITMQHDYTILSKRIFLRPITEADIENLRVLRNANRQFFLGSDEITPEMQKKWFAHYLEKQDDIMFVVEDRANPGVFAGAISLYDIDWETGRCEVGRTVMDKTKLTYKNVGAEATAAICAFGFDKLNLKVVIGNCYVDNIPMMKANEKAGHIFLKETDGVMYMEMTKDTVNREIIDPEN